MSSKEWIHEQFASLLGFSEDTSVDFILMIGKYLDIYVTLNNSYFT
jgi:hypothetical protein